MLPQKKRKKKKNSPNKTSPSNNAPNGCQKTEFGQVSGCAPALHPVHRDFGAEVTTSCYIR